MTAKRKSKTAVTYAPFEIADYLGNDAVIAAYLSQAARDDNPAILLKALSDVAKARGIAKISEASGLGRESLYKALAPGAKPRFETVAAIMRALGVTFSIEAQRAKPPRKLKAA